MDENQEFTESDMEDLQMILAGLQELEKSGSTWENLMYICLLSLIHI